MVDLTERLNGMLEQEARHYTTQDYLAPSFQAKLASLKLDDDDSLPPQDKTAESLPSASSTNLSGSLIPQKLDSSKQETAISSSDGKIEVEGSSSRARDSVANSNSSSSTASSTSGINEIWRERICEWSYQVIDHFDFSREVVSISMHYLDKYLATRPVNKKQFQLAAMTSLFIAIKLHEPGRLSMSSMIELSRGYFRPEQMAAMEMSILRTLCWHMHPPTSFSFVKHMLLLLPQVSVSMETRHDVLELARFLTELSVIDYYFVMHRTSTIAVAALMIAMEELPGSSRATTNLLVSELAKISLLHGSSEELAACRGRLRLLYAQGGYSHPSAAAEARPDTNSPVCVSYGCNPYELAHGSAAVERPKASYTAEHAPCSDEAAQSD
ncbi:hypothetical protein MPSEU_000386700 [Mayamaea pseudoterrestris]|nr:hypothetical protein MPSEU_000386700 [Mayamaea pseudoterrestris]